jgi:hypothetical protein
MDQDVAEAQESVAPPRKKAKCTTCGKGFSCNANLNKHAEAKHTDQTTPEAKAKDLTRKECHNAQRRERRANDSVYCEQQRQTSATNRTEKKARDATAAEQSCTHEQKLVRDATAAGGAHTLPASESKLHQGLLHGGTNATATAPCVFRVRTTVLTTANVIDFFLPKYPALRSKEQRLTAPRSSAI